MKNQFLAIFTGILASVGVTGGASALTLGPDFAADYSAVSLGSVSGVPSNYGGLTFLPTDPNKILLGGAANTASGRLYSVNLVRDATTQKITGFSGTPTAFGDVGDYNDGGVVFGPGGVLFTAQWNVNNLGQTKPGSSDEDRVDALAGLGIGGSSISALNFVPTGFGGAGQAKVVTYSAGQWHDLSLTSDGAGTFDLSASRVDLDPSTTTIDNLPGGPEGFVYINSGNPGFSNDSMLVSAYANNTVDTYEVDTNGNPVLSSRRTFLSGLVGAEGAVIDPITGDFLFSTFGGGSQIVRVSGFIAPPPPPPAVPLPAGVWFMLGALGCLGMVRRRRA
jgi:hypothetical protein